MIVSLSEETTSSMDDLAKHEALEVMLWPVRSLLDARYSESLVDDEMHKIVHKLAKVRLK